MVNTADITEQMVVGALFVAPVGFIAVLEYLSVLFILEHIGALNNPSIVMALAVVLLVLTRTAGKNVLEE